MKLKGLDQHKTGLCRWILQSETGVKMMYTQEVLSPPWIRVRPEDLDRVKVNPKAFDFGDGTEPAVEKPEIEFVLGTTIAEAGDEVAFSIKGDVLPEGVNVLIGDEPFTIMPDEAVNLVSDGTTIIRLNDKRYWAKRGSIGILRKAKDDENNTD